MRAEWMEGRASAPVQSGEMRDSPPAGHTRSPAQLLTEAGRVHRIRAWRARFRHPIDYPLPPRSMVGQLTLDQHIGVRIPGGQPILFM